MDPYLEAPGLWPDVHNSLIASVRYELFPRLFPRYYVALEERTYALAPLPGEDAAWAASLLAERGLAS